MIGRVVLSVCVVFLYTVVRGSLLSRLAKAGLEKLSIFFDFFGKLDVDFKVWKVVALKH